jgi:protein dithiol:quinone oxidoreductase
MLHLMLQRSFFARLQLFALFCFLLFSVYMQYGLHLVPCILCYIQRIIMLFLLGCTLLKCWRLVYTQKTWLFDVLCFLGLVLGGVLAYHHVYLQQNPHLYVDACLPSLGILWRYYDWSKVLQLLFNASHGCNEIMWRFWGVTIPGWLFLGYCFLLILWLLEWVSAFVLRHSLVRVSHPDKSRSKRRQQSVEAD